MLYNKNQFNSVNDKKVLHKIKKHWITVSIAMLSLIGGGALTTTEASANTDNANVNNHNGDQANHSLNVNRVQDSQAKLVTNNQNDHNNQITSQANDANIKAKTDRLHKNIINNVVNSTMKSNVGQVKNDYQATQTQSKVSSFNGIKSTKASAGLSRSTSTSVNNASLAAESAFVSNAMASVLSHGGHMISVSPAVRSFMINGASEIASYNRITESNANATFNYLNSLSPSTSSLASKKSLAESYAQNFYTNKQNRNNMIMNGEAAHDIKIWGEDPDYFTLYQADPGRIINNVQSFYEPNASTFASLTNSVKNHVAQMTSYKSSTAALSPSMSANASHSASQDTKSLAKVLSNDASTLNSYNQENSNYVNTILVDLDTLDVSNSPILSYAKNNVSKYSNRINSFMNKETNEANSLNNYSNYSNSAANASTISTANKAISQASMVANKTSSVIEKYIEPLESQSSANDNTSRSSLTSTTANQSLSNSVQDSILVNHYFSSVKASNSTRNSLMTSASISNSVANSIANENAQVNSPKMTSQSNSRVNPNLNEQNTSNNIVLDKSNDHQSSSNSTDLVHFGDDSSSRNTRSDVNMPDAPQSNHVIKANQQTNNQLNSDTDDTGNLNNNGNDTNNQNQIASTDNDQPSNQSINNSQRTSEGINTVNGNGQNEGTETTHDSGPMINNSTINAADVESNQDTSTNTSANELPQTGDPSFKSREIAEIALIMSAAIGLLTAYIDKRHNN